MQSKNTEPVLFALPIVFLFAVFILAMAWTGFYGGDDFKYYRGAIEWIQAFPPVTTDPGAIRMGVVIPMAISLAFLGDSEFSAILSTSSYYIAFILFVAYSLSRLTDAATVIVASAVLASIPVLAIYSTAPSADLANLLYASLSFFFFYAALDHKRRNTMLFLSGFFVGIEFLCHEQSFAMLVFYGLLFVVGYRIDRKLYLYLAFGFITVVSAEMIYYTFAAHNPFHRFMVSWETAQTVDRWMGPKPEFGSIDNAGNLYIWPPINPIVLTLITQKYGILYYILYPAMWWTVRGHIIRDEATTQLMRLLLALGVVWFLFAVIALSQIKLYARYYLPATCCFFIVSVFWLRYVIWPNRKRMATLAVLSVLTVNFLCIAVENKEPRFGDRALLEYLSISSEQVLTDTQTARYAKYFCHWERIDCSRIVVGEPTPGRIYFLNPKNSNLNPDPSWKEIWRFEQPRKWPGRIITSLGLRPFVPGEIFRRLDQPNKTVYVYAIPDGTAVYNPERAGLFRG